MMSGFVAHRGSHPQLLVTGKALIELFKSISVSASGRKSALSETNRVTRYRITNPKSGPSPLCPGTGMVSEYL
jgi:hypothetical protein